MALFGWTLVGSHLPGLFNTRADSLSRILDAIDFYDPSFFRRFQMDVSPTGRELAVDIQKVSTSSEGLSIAADCRRLLMQAIVSPASMPTPVILGSLLRLASRAGGASAK